METSAASPEFILDAIGPFLEGNSRHRINWSKIDFHHLESGEGLTAGRVARVGERLRQYAARVAADGASGLAFDDLAHLYLDPAYPPALRDKVRRYREAYRVWFDIAAAEGLRLYVNTDILFVPAGLNRRGLRPRDPLEVLHAACMQVFADFPQLQGVFFRLGECDGQDVRGDFLSQLVLKTPRQANRLLKHLLPLFEQGGKRLFLRTWTVGAYPIGDMIWNPRTLAKVLEGIDSPALVLSMKFGESDFFRHLELNRQFFRTPVAKMVELQTRREYEGAGEYPCFVGYDYEAYWRALSGAQHVIGAHIWCQTGGWTAFRRLTYLEPEGLWNEINTFVTLRMLRDRLPVEAALAAWVRERRPETPLEPFLELMRLSEEVVRELMYLDDFAGEPIYFRRTRIPPQMMVYWDHIFVNHRLRKVLRCFVRDPEAKVRQANAAMVKLTRMQACCDACGLPADDLAFMRDTFAILAAARAYCLLPYDVHRREALEALKAKYKARWRHRYRYAVKLDFDRMRLPRSRLALLLRVMFRKRSRYRLIDKIVTVWLLGLLYPLMRLGGRRFFTGFASKQAMGVGTVFR